MEYTLMDIAPIVLFPFAAFAVNFILGIFWGKKVTKIAVTISTVAIFLSAIWASRIFLDFMGVYSADYKIWKFFTWFDLAPANFKINMGVFIDNMTAVMLLMVTWVAFLIHVFSTFYMKDDIRYGRFFVYMSLFTSAMLGLVLGDNLLMIFIFWELMGFCSYSLIGFYYENEKAGSANVKAFMTTRVGDVCFLLAILALWNVLGSVSIVDIYNGVAAGKLDANVPGLPISVATFSAIMLFLGTIGKSAQFPLNVWLPDAMMGPTPCSALIHAATMVAAGVYLSLRMYPVMEAGGITYFIAIIGGITAFGAATIALVQTDFKAVLAFSTISQLGYMVLGIGVGNYNAAFMHLITHAVFKACLFLSAGSVIHSLHDHHTHAHVQEMPRMGGLRHKLPFTYWAMVCCTLAIAGVPLFSGFVSKDRILGDALYLAMYKDNWYYIPALLGFAGAILTAFYMTRMMVLAFWGEPRDKEVYDHCHKETLSWNRNIPLLILAFFTLGLFYSGSLEPAFLKTKVFSEKYEWFDTLVQKPKVNDFSSVVASKLNNSQNIIDKAAFERSTYDPKHGYDDRTYIDVHHAHLIGAIASVIIAFSGILFAWFMYEKKKFNPDTFVNTFKGYYKILVGRYFMDEFYIGVLIQKGLLRFNNILAKFDLNFYDRIFVDGWQYVNRWFYRVCSKFDEYVVDKAGVDGLGGGGVRFLNLILVTLQSGKVQFYFFVIIIVLTGYIYKVI